MSAPESPRLSTGAWLRLLLLVGFFVAAVAAFRFTPLRELVDQQRLVAILERVRENPAAPFVFVVLFVVLASIGSPTSPLVLAAGATFGLWLGTALSLIGVMGTATVVFFAARGLAYDLVVRLVGTRHRQIERLIARHGFWALVRLRFVPIPFFLANVGCALAGVRPSVFLVSTFLSQVPVLLIWCYFASSLIEAGAERATAVRNLIGASLLLLAMSFVPPRVTAWRRRRRYFELLRQRAARQNAG